MGNSRGQLLSRRRVCLCCIGAGASAAAGGWLTPREAFAEARGIVSLIKDSAAVSPIVTHKLRNNITVLEGSGGTIAVLSGPDGKVLIDAGIAVSRPQMMRITDRPRRRSNHASRQYTLALRPYQRQHLAQCSGCENHRAGEHAQVSLPSPACGRLGLQFPRTADRRNSQRGVRRGAYPQAQRTDDRA